MTLLSLSGHDRATLQALVTFQQATPLQGLTGVTRDEAHQALRAFQGRAASVVAQPFTERQRAAFDRSFAALLDAVLAQPPVALHPALSGPGAGPITQDMARLLRQAALDEEAALDLAVRWWQLARGAGLPVEADFGECFRLIEWTGLLQQLSQQAPPWNAAVKVALRFAPIKPLVLLLEPLSGASAQAGYTF